MKFYIAARTSEIPRVQEMTEVLKSMGHECTHNWAVAKNADLQRPYYNHVEEVSVFAQEDLDGAKNAEIFIILCDKSGTGMFVEMGAALSSGAKVYAIGEHNDMTVFHFHPRVIRVDSFDRVLEDLSV